MERKLLMSISGLGLEAVSGHEATAKPLVRALGAPQKTSRSSRRNTDPTEVGDEGKGERLVVIWVVTWIALHVTSALIHLLLVLAAISLVLHFVRGRSPSRV